MPRLEQTTHESSPLPRALMGDRDEERKSHRSPRGNALPLSIVSSGMLARKVIVAPPEVVFVKSILEASDGLACLFAERGGELTLVAPRDRAEELSELLADLERDVGARLATEDRA